MGLQDTLQHFCLWTSLVSSPKPAGVGNSTQQMCTWGPALPFPHQGITGNKWEITAIYCIFYQCILKYLIYLLSVIRFHTLLKVYRALMATARQKHESQGCRTANDLCFQYVGKHSSICTEPEHQEAAGQSRDLFHPDLKKRIAWHDSKRHFSLFKQASKLTVSRFALP